MGPVKYLSRKTEFIHGSPEKLFRSKIQQHANSTYIFSGSYESVMNQMFVSGKSPFHRLARIIRLGYIEQQPLVASLTTRFSSLGITIPASFPEEIIRFTRGHPYYSQLAFQQVVLNKSLTGKVPSLKELTALLLVVEKDYLEKTWEHLSRNKEVVYTLLAVAEGGDNIYQRLKHRKINIARAIRKLEGMGLLFRHEDGRYYISDPIFEQWLRDRL